MVHWFVGRASGDLSEVAAEQAFDLRHSARITVAEEVPAVEFTVPDLGLAAFHTVAVIDGAEVSADALAFAGAGVPPRTGEVGRIGRRILDAYVAAAVPDDLI